MKLHVLCQSTSQHTGLVEATSDRGLYIRADHLDILSARNWKCVTIHSNSMWHLCGIGLGANCSLSRTLDVEATLHFALTTRGYLHVTGATGEKLNLWKGSMVLLRILHPANWMLLFAMQKLLQAL